MIMYNTLIGVAAGAAMILVPRYWAWLRNERMPFSETPALTREDRQVLAAPKS